MTLGQQNADLQITASFVVMAVGGGCQIPSMPVYPGRVRFPEFDQAQYLTSFQEEFGGIVQHSADYTSASKWGGKSGIVVGTANTGMYFTHECYEKRDLHFSA